MSTLTVNEIKLLEACKEAQIWWWAGLIRAASVMVDRRKKYSGGHDPYFNFLTIARKRDTTVEDILDTYIDMKSARLDAASGDFPDESMIDTSRDRANYALLHTGWFIRKGAK